MKLEKFISVKIWTVFAVILLAAVLASAEKVRVSYLFIHYSVGQSAVNNCGGANGNIRQTLDTMKVIYGTDTARIVFRSYNINFDHLDSSLSDTVYRWSSADWCNIEDRINTGFDYNLQGAVNRNRIYDAENYSPLLRNFFKRPFKEDSVFWKMFTEHQIPYPGGNQIWEHYDMVIFKNPYIIWQNFTTAKADSIKKWYVEVRDSVLNHPDINVALAMGTPLAYNTGSADDFNGDTSMAKLVYNLASWFNSDSFFTHNNSGPYKNVWHLNSYQPMCETAAGHPQRYCLKNEYWAGYDSQAHLSTAGMTHLQNQLIAFIRNATMDILIQKSGLVTRQDIDLKIKEFREGTATEQEVIDLIEQFNNGQ